MAAFLSGWWDVQQDVAIPPLWQLNNEGMVLHCWHVEEYWLQSGEIFGTAGTMLC